LKSLALISARVKWMFVEDLDTLAPGEGIEGLHPKDFLLLLVRIGDVAKLVPGVPKAPMFSAVPFAPPLDVTVDAL